MSPFEALAIDRSAPSSSGRCSSGVASVLSTASSAPSAWAAAASAATSSTARPGLDGVSIQTSVAPGSAAVIASASVAHHAHLDAARAQVLERELPDGGVAVAGHDDHVAGRQHRQQHRRDGGQARAEQHRLAALELSERRLVAASTSGWRRARSRTARRRSGRSGDTARRASGPGRNGVPCAGAGRPACTTRVARAPAPRGSPRAPVAGRRRFAHGADATRRRRPRPAAPAARAATAAAPAARAAARAAQPAQAARSASQRVRGRAAQLAHVARAERDEPQRAERRDGRRRVRRRGAARARRRRRRGRARPTVSPAQRTLPRPGRDEHELLRERPVEQHPAARRDRDLRRVRRDRGELAHAQRAAGTSATPAAGSPCPLGVTAARNTVR